MALLQVGVPALPAHPRGDRGPHDGDGADPLPRRRRAQARPRPHGPPDRPARPPRRGQLEVARARAIVEGPIRSGQRLGRVEVSQGGKVVATVAADRRSRPCPRPDIAQKHQVGAATPSDRAGVAFAVACRYGPAGARRARGQRRPAPPPDERRMIVTVTLNTAIDKTLVGAQLPARAPPPHRRADDDAGRQGRQRRARAQDARRARDRHRASPAARPARASSTSSRSSRVLSRLRPHRRGVAHEHRGDRPHDRRADRDQRARARRSRAHEVELFVDKLLYLAKGASVCVFAGSLPRDVDTDIYAFLIRELRRLNVTTVIDTDGDPLRRAVRAEPDVISPNVLEAEELVGHEFNDDEDRTYAVERDVRARRARGDHDDDRRRASRACCPHEGAAEPSLYRVRVRGGAIEPRATVGSGDAFLAGFVAARYQRPAGRGGARLRRRLRRRVHPAPRRRPGRSRPGRAAARRGRGRAALAVAAEPAVT